MYAQLGSVVFQGVFGFSNFSTDGDEAVYGEFALLGKKPRLQKTGETLQELSITIKLHAEFCNPTQQLDVLKKSKADGEVLPLLMGNGKYIADYVIISMPYTTDEAFADGTIKQATVSLTIKEYIAYNKQEQAEQAARKNAFAIGDKKPIVQVKPQDVSKETQITIKITETKQQAAKIDGLVADAENNASGLAIASRKIKKSCDAAVKSIADMNSIIDSANEIKTDFTAIKSIAVTATTAFTGIKGLFPLSNIGDLKTGNVYLQGVIRSLTRVSGPIFQDVILRKKS